MEQYVKKSALIAEIERRIKEIDEIGTYLSPKGVLTNFLCYIDTLEVKEINSTDAFIKKACAFLETYPHMFFGVLRSDMIEDFKKAMEE